MKSLRKFVIICRRKRHELKSLHNQKRLARNACLGFRNSNSKCCWHQSNNGNVNFKRAFDFRENDHWQWRRENGCYYTSAWNTKSIIISALQHTDKWITIVNDPWRLQSHNNPFSMLKLRKQTTTTTTKSYSLDLIKLMNFEFFFSKRNK